MRPRRQAGAILALGAIALTIVLSGCGISTGGPALVSKGQIPPDLLAKNPPTTTTTTSPQSAFSRQFNVYLANTNNQLVGVQVFTGIHTSLRDALNQNLFQSNTGANGLFTYLGTVALLGANAPANPTNGSVLVTLNLDSAFDELSGTQLTLAVGQLVLTATSFEVNSAKPTSVEVAFEVENNPINVPIGNGTVAAGPVSWSDYACLTTSCSP